ncbi:hypothetical protein P0O24_00840 [Methanotrichaceae archaeon M04Ac]|jgi:hypothetical protein|uniref:Uncharacterized protein n=1 Tax=Candidatus Methanocrinis alkalitolerans TaxID=3033395 RepID=A0ABT5XBP7_9EURY|nr:hypothetical protein [Candidatus Methanocrinis alkalitolerans]MDF0592134.1 hypothetical protein [Candidatus Methanocrinis alkalitolerans]
MKAIPFEEDVAEIEKKKGQNAVSIFSRALSNLAGTAHPDRSKASRRFWFAKSNRAQDEL